MYIKMIMKRINKIDDGFHFGDKRRDGCRLACSKNSWNRLSK